MKSNRGITLIALVVTIIVLIIIAGVSLNAIGGTKGNIVTSKDELAMYELSQLQQAVFETFIKAKQLDNERSLVGTKISWSDANSYLQEIAEESGKTLTLKQSSYSDVNTVDSYECYYKLEKVDLENLGLRNGEDTYIVNYSTGEVFNIDFKSTSDKKALYVYSKD